MDTRGWYVLATSPSGNSVFATLGPFLTRARAEEEARHSRLAYFRVEQTGKTRRRVPLRSP
jgi:hypothetical protein